MYLICFYVPESHLEAVKQSMFQAGAGKLGSYEQCAWQTKGQGQFVPLADSDPFSGQKGKMSYESEFKVEMICEDHLVSQVIQALKDSHPYEVPAYHVLKTEKIC